MNTLTAGNIRTRRLLSLVDQPAVKAATRPAPLGRLLTNSLGVSVIMGVEGPQFKRLCQQAELNVSDIFITNSCQHINPHGMIINLANERVGQLIESLQEYCGQQLRLPTREEGERLADNSYEMSQLQQEKGIDLFYVQGKTRISRTGRCLPWNRTKLVTGLVLIIDMSNGQGS